MTDANRSTVPFDQGGQILEQPVGVGCPRCHRELAIGTLQGCQFAGCPDCGGMLFRQSVFGRLIQQLRATSTQTEVPQPLDRDELQQRSQCPACDGAMETHSYAGPGNSVVDTCFACGLIWFDRGEFNRLVRAPGKR